MRPFLLRSSLSPSCTCPRFSRTRTVRTSPFLLCRWLDVSCGACRGWTTRRCFWSTCLLRRRWLLGFLLGKDVHAGISHIFKLVIAFVFLTVFRIPFLALFLSCAQFMRTSILETRQDPAFNSFFRTVDSFEDVAEGRRRQYAGKLGFLLRFYGYCCCRMLVCVLIRQGVRFRTPFVKVLVSSLPDTSQLVTKASVAVANIPLFAPNASVPRNSCPARDGNILTVGDKCFLCAEVFFYQVPLVQVQRFYYTSLRSNMNRDVYILKELYAISFFQVSWASFGACPCS